MKLVFEFDLGDGFDLTTTAKPMVRDFFESVLDRIPKDSRFSECLEANSPGKDFHTLSEANIGTSEGDVIARCVIVDKPFDKKIYRTRANYTAAEPVTVGELVEREAKRTN